jgi:hypothetical protein
MLEGAIKPQLPNILTVSSNGCCFVWAAQDWRGGALLLQARVQQASAQAVACGCRGDLAQTVDSLDLS